MNLPILRTSYVVVVLATAFNLGRYSVEFNGTGWGWAAVIFSIVALAVSIFALVHDFWTAKA